MSSTPAPIHVKHRQRHEIVAGEPPPAVFPCSPLYPESPPLSRVARSEVRPQLRNPTRHEYVRLWTSSRACHGDQTDEEGVQSKLSGTSVAFSAPTDPTHEIYTVESIAGMHRYEVVICDMFSH